MPDKCIALRFSPDVTEVVIVSAGSTLNSVKNTTTLFSLSDHCILSRGWGVIVDQEQTNYYHCRPMVL